jgi:hypothetical protein
MQNGVFIDDPDRQLATQYLRAVFTLVEAVRRDGGPDERTVMQISETYPDDFGRRVGASARRPAARP